jgi:hypothetical protein
MEQKKNSTNESQNQVQVYSADWWAWRTLNSQAKALLASGFLSAELKAGKGNEALAKICTIIMMGDELGIGRTQALRSIHVIQGKPTLGAELMLALAYKKIPGFRTTFKTPVEKQHEECEVVMQRPGGDENTFRFTIQDAKNAGIYKPNSGWTKYPRAMLRARAVSEGLRAVAPDATMGLYATEELQDDFVDVTPGQTTPEPGSQASAALSQTSAGSEKQVEPQKAEPEKKQPTGNTVGFDKRQEANRIKGKEKPVTEAQIRLLRAKGNELGWDDEMLHDYAFREFDKEHLPDLTMNELDKFLQELDSGSASGDADPHEREAT